MQKLFQFWLDFIRLHFCNEFVVGHVLFEQHLRNVVEPYSFPYFLTFLIHPFHMQVMAFLVDDRICDRGLGNLAEHGLLI